MNVQEFLKKEDGKIIIPVPSGIRYMSEWKDFDLNFFGNCPFILDKQIPGCGFTEYCLINNDDIILTSPRRLLLENKESQHKGDIHYFQNNCDDTTVDKDLSKPPVTFNRISVPIEEILDENRSNKEKEENCEELSDMEKALIEYINIRDALNLPSKIIVTYDSFKHLKRFLIKDGRLGRFKIIVDEFQSIFVDSRFKATTEFSFLEELRNLSNQICFVSATPMMDQYLMQLDYFKGLLYFKLDWGIKDPARVMNPELKVRKIRSINTEIKRIIKEYRDGNFSVLANPITGQPIQSREAVFYVNSVSNILSVILSEKLMPNEVNILCSNTLENRKRLIKKLGKKYMLDEENIGRVPLKGEPHKMFTFCTRTVYLGADFYSTCARTFILSDANIDSLAVDISLDLPQILGRQRLIENPWKNHAEFYFKNLGSGKNVTKKEFDDFLEFKMKESDRLLRAFSSADPDAKLGLINTYRRDAISSNYRYNYVSVNSNYSSPIPVFNNLVYISEQRAFDIQQVDYKDRFTVFSTLKTSSGIKFDKVSEFIDEMRDTGVSLSSRFKKLCESEDFTEEEKRIIAQQVSEKFDRFYNLLGPERCKAHGYRSSDIQREIDFLLSKENLESTFKSRFEIGKRYSNAEAKVMIGKIYEEVGITGRIPKATDLNNYFDLKKVLMTVDGKKINGFEILNIKRV